MTEPKTHLGHWIGPAPTNEELGLHKKKEEACKSCGHSLENNLHGPDQDDFIETYDGYVYGGRCKYCKECQRD